ncbi:hypothetical protein GLOIN_2v1783702 [Rhizophagus clarus]|uniref:Uncharacterized protein n=1 Tax=Rhizophagus clarus TaxID=94130 RepID=A0A8H3LFC7_9GLOM|nr:hypothetical protein GLOIN_2v1783702 [Rhizophagus clarus]
MINNMARKQARIGVLDIDSLIFYGYPEEDPEDFLRDFQRYVVASQINVALEADQAAGRAEVLGLLISYFEESAMQWYETRIKALAVGNEDGQVGSLNTAGEFQDEDWSIASGELTNSASVVPNVTGGFSAMAVFGQLMQGDMGIEEFSTQIKKISKLAGMTPKQQRKQLIHDLNALAEVEKFTLSQKNAPSSIPVFLATNSYVETSKSVMTKTEIENLIKTTMASSQPQQNVNL